MTSHDINNENPGTHAPPSVTDETHGKPDPMKIHDKSRQQHEEPRNQRHLMKPRRRDLDILPFTGLSTPILKDPHLLLEAVVRQVADSLTAERQDQSRKEGSKKVRTNRKGSNPERRSQYPLRMEEGDRKEQSKR